MRIMIAEVSRHILTKNLQVPCLHTSVYVHMCVRIYVYMMMMMMMMCGTAAVCERDRQRNK